MSFFSGSLSPLLYRPVPGLLSGVISFGQAFSFGDPSALSWSGLLSPQPTANGPSSRLWHAKDGHEDYVARYDSLRWASIYSWPQYDPCAIGSPILVTAAQ